MCNMLLSSKVFPNHITCFSQCGHHQVFKTVVNGNCCASSIVVSVFVMWSCLCVCISCNDGSFFLQILLHSFSFDSSSCSFQSKYFIPLSQSWCVYILGTTLANVPTWSLTTKSLAMCRNGAICERSTGHGQLLLGSTNTLGPLFGQEQHLIARSQSSDQSFSFLITSTIVRFEVFTAVTMKYFFTACVSC
jgi:hypothetical protein